jgi:hypothetical protein
MGFCKDIMIFENDDSEGMYFKMLNHAEAIQVEIFGARYARNSLLPECVNKIVGKYLSVRSGMEDEEEEENPDRELIANSLDTSLRVVLSRRKFTTTVLL